MLDLLSPVRGYIAQSLQFYLSKYIEDIQLEGLGLFGGDLVLNDLEIKRHVLRESLDIPSSFDFSRGFIRELRIHIPWTQLLSQPIEVKLYTIELILTAKKQADAAPKTPAASTAAPDAPEDDKIEQPKSGWIHDTLQKILANVSVQINNLVLKYEHDDVVFSIALGTLDFYSASESGGWKRSFEDLRGGRRAVCKRIDARDVTIFLDRYTSDGAPKDGQTQDRVRRKVVGYEVPVLSRTSASVRAKLQLFPNAAVNEDQDGRRSRPSSPLHQKLPTVKDAYDEENIIDVDGLFAYRPSVMSDPFYSYSCNRSSAMPMYEVDVFIGELLFSVSDRQLEMLNQLVTSASRKIDQAHGQGIYRANVSGSTERSARAQPSSVRTIPTVTAPSNHPVDDQQPENFAKKPESWLGWAMNALGTTEDEEEDELVSELLAETRGALLKAQPPVSDADEDMLAAGDPVTKTSCVRVCISSASLTLRKHEKEEQEMEHQEATIGESGEELVPVANLGMVKVSLQTKKRKVARPAVPILHLSLSYIALEMLLARGEEQSGTDLVFEIEKVELVSATASENREDSKCKKGLVLLTWGSIDSSHFSDCVSHPYFINSFFGEETTRLNQRETRSFEIVKVSLDADIPVWKTLEVDRSRRDSDENADSQCNCATTWNGEAVRCIPIATLSDISQQTVRAIGIKERVLDGGILSNSVSTAWASNGFPISISESMARTFTSIAEEYRALRKPDVGAHDNLTQLLQPQLVALFSRYSLHSCSEASLHGSFLPSNIRHRSVHSALRLRLASTSNFSAGDGLSPGDYSREETISKVLDVSVGAAQAVLNPQKCVEIMEAVSIILRCREDDNKSELGGGKASVPATENVPSSLRSIVQSDVKVVTVSSVRIRLPESSARSGSGELEANSSGGLNVTARDLTWLLTFRPGSSTCSLQLGLASAHLEKACQNSTPTSLVETVGFELLITESSADGGDRDELFVNLDKVKVTLCLPAVQDVMILTNAVTSPLGYPIAWKPENTMPKTSRIYSQAEVCGASLSRTVLNRPRLLMAQRQSLGAEVASITVNLKRSSNTACETNRSILQSGVAPMKIRESGVVTPFLKLEVLQEKSSGMLNTVPMICSIKLFSLNPELLATTCERCQLAINGQVAHVYVELQGIFRLVDEALNIVKRITASLPVGKEPKPMSSDANQSAMMDTLASNVPTNWRFTIDVRTAGGRLRINEALQLNIPAVSLSSVETDTDHSSETTPGGAIKITFSLQDAVLNVSEDGVLKELADPVVLRVQGCRATVDILHSFVDRRLAYAVDVTLHVSSIQASLSRLKLLYLLKLPFTKPEPIHLDPTEVSQSMRPNGRKVSEKLDLPCRWHLRLGAQFDLVNLSCTADVNQQANHRNRRTRAVVDGKVLNICVATRIANHHPIKSYIEGSRRRSFADIQASIGDVQIVERLQSTKQNICAAFGEFSRLPEHAFLGILVCLDLPELKCLSESVNVASSSIPDQESLPLAMLSWHLTSSIAKACHESRVQCHLNEAVTREPITEIPLVVSGSGSSLAKPAHSFPVLSGFYRNYGEASVPHHSIAGSMESVDIAVTTSSLYCLASVLNVAKSKPNSHQSNKTETDYTSECEVGAQDLPETATPVSLADVEVSLLLGQVRLILPSECLMDSIISRRSVVTGNAFLVVESLSVVSAVRNDISLDGLGYPPFNSRVLPRRSTVQAQRFGQSRLRIGCRAGKITGFVAELEFNKSAPNSIRTLEAIGPFEEHIGRASGCSACISNSETFWSPFNVTCNIEEEALAASGGSDAEAKTSVTIALTKVRLDLHKPLFDILVNRVMGTAQGVGAFCRSVVAPSHVVLKAVQVSEFHKLSPRRVEHREVSFSCDGVEVNTFDAGASTHIRVGAIVFVHDLSDLSGNASIQNVVVGHRTVGDPRSPTQRTIATEEVVFGAHAEPSLWQLSVENYPEKLIAARWNFGDRTEGTLFLDVQAYQLHVSHHFILALARFVHSDPELQFSGSCLGKTNEHNVESVLRRPFAFRPRWNIKVLVAPSIMSYWRQTPTKNGRSGVWMTSGQVFASAGVGSGETFQQSLLIHGQTINEMNRFVAVPSLEMMLNVDKFGINTSDDLPPLEVHFQRSTVGPVPTQTASTWQRFSKYVSAISEPQRLLHNCSVRLTGDQHQMIERVAVNDGVCLLYTSLTRTSIQAEVNALCVKLSSFSLGAIQSLLTARMDGGKQANRPSQGPTGGTCENYAEGAFDRRSFGLEKSEVSSTDDFKSLRRMAEGRRPSPGELVLTEALLIETQSVASSSFCPVSCMKARIQIEPTSYNIGLDDVAAFLEDCNEPWGVEEQDERSSITGLDNKTHSWMSMRWCYHIPRKLCKIVASPVPIPPTGVPSGWPSWSWDPDQEGEARRFCDILCQLRCWDSQKACFVVVCEFLVPWERVSTNANYDNSDDAYEPGSFGELVSQWFDDGLEETRYRAKLLEFGARTRTFSLDVQPPSDNWELRWRCPLQSEQETENKQKRLVVNALLASSLQIHSTLACDAYQRVISNVTLPQVTLSVSHVGSASDSHDIITAEINDTVISCAVSGISSTRTLSLRVSSAIQVYLNNMVQLLTVSVIPRTTIDAMIEASAKGLAISALIGPVSVYLNQTSMLVLSSIPKLLRAGPKSSQRMAADEKLASMRIRISNYSGVDIWYQQEGTSECLFLAASASAAYSWLSLASSPFYQLRFAIDDPLQKRVENVVNQKDSDQGEQSAKTDPRWCDPCRIKDNAVTGRYFSGHGFLWICVELSGLQTIVTLRSSLTVYNYCDFLVRIKLNKKAEERRCARSDTFYQDIGVAHGSAHRHSSWISLDGSACTLGPRTEADDNVSRIMVESVSRVDFGIDGGSWCSVAPHERIPSEFDLVKVSDDQADSFKKAQYSFATLHPENPDERTQYAWVKIGRVQCKTILPTDFDPLQPQVSRRYTWMEVSFWPAVTVENIMDTPVVLSFSQKATTVNLRIAPSSQKCMSAINPFEPVAVKLSYEKCPGTAQSSLKPQKFVLECNTPASGKKEQIFDLDGCRLVATFTDESHPTIRIRTECILSVANMTSSILNVKIGSPLGNQGALEKIESSVERFVGLSVVSNRLVISIAAIDDTTNEAGQTEWSPEVSLNVNGDTKPIVVPPARSGLRTLTCAYCIELVNSDGYLKLIIRPQVVVINSTNRDLKFLPTDSRGNALVEENASLQAISGKNAGWCVPVCLHKEAKKRSITAGVSSWLSSKLSRRPSEDLSSSPKQALVARLSCSFRVSLVEDGFEWTEEIAVLLPKLPLQLDPDGKLKIVELPASSTAPPNAQEGLYPAPSTTTHRRRLLIRHRGFRHKMVTYTMTQKGSSVHILFFVDHQPSVIIHNQWQNVLGFRNVSFPSDPEGIDAEFYLDYDWDLQVSAKQREPRQKVAEENSDTEGPNQDDKMFTDWLEASAQSLDNTGISTAADTERTRFKIGSPQYGWSNTLWQVGGIQFASFRRAEESGPRPTFLVMCFYRAGSWLISITCLEDPTREGQASPVPSLVLPSMTSPTKAKQTPPASLRIGVVVEELSLHFCDEHDPVRDARGMILYPEILRATCNTVSIVFATAPDPPEVSRHSARLGYLSHIRSYTTLFVAVEDIEVGHFLQTCNFPVILCFPETHASKDLLQFDRVKKYEKLSSLMGSLLDKRLPGAENSSVLARVIYTDTWDPVGIPSYFHSIELKLSPAVLQVEDDILSYLNAFIRPVLDALEGETAFSSAENAGSRSLATSHGDAWNALAYQSVMVTKQRKVFIEHFEISNLQVTVTARVSIPVLNSFDGTPLYFGATEMREVFAFPDQLYKDLAADYVADTIVRSPMLLMSLNIIGNPAGFLRSFGQGVRDLVEIPLAASRSGYSPWVLTKGVVGGVASFVGHATAATLTSVSGFSYSISRTMDQLTLPPDQLRKRHYTRPTQLSSALTGGLGSLGSSVVGAATGVITTPIAIYRQRQMQGLDTGIRNVVGGVGMGLVGIVARPMGGVASLVSMASDGLLYGMGGNRTPFDDSVSQFDARPNELLRYKLKVLPDAIGSTLIFAHGIWIVPDENKVITCGHELDCISQEELEAPENEPTRSLLRPTDATRRLVRVTVVCSSESVYVVGVGGAQNQSVLVHTSLASVEAVEESLTEPTVFDLGIKTPTSAEWLRFRLPPRQRRNLSHQLRLWLAENVV